MNDIQFRWRGNNLEYRIQRTERITSGSYDVNSLNWYDQFSWSAWKKVSRVSVRRVASGSERDGEGG